MSSNILKYIITLDDRLEIINELDQLNEIIVNEDIKNISQSAKKIARSYTYEALFGNHNEMSDKRLLVDLINDMRRQIIEMKQLDLEVPIPLTEITKEKVGKWVKERISVDAVINIKLNRTLLAGCRISFEGKFIDLSLREKFNQYWTNNKVKVVSQIGLT